MRYEMLLALEKSQRCRRLCLTLFLLGVDRTLVECQLFGVLSHAMLVPINVNKDNWQERLKQNMLDKLQGIYSKILKHHMASVTRKGTFRHFT